MHIVGTAASDRGRRRETNEDTWHVDDRLGLYVVCDGMGGHQAGEVASRLAIEAVVDIVTARHREDPAPRQRGEECELTRTVEEAVAHACRVVYRSATDDPAHAGMGCTLTMLLAAGDRAVMGHVGDTRLYLLRDGRAHQLSTDHTMAAELARAGVIRPEEVKTHRLAHVLTRSIGAQSAVPIDTLSIELLPEDRFVICSDGLSDYLKSGAALYEQIEGVETRGVPKLLVSFANGEGGRDNVTVVAVEVMRDASQVGATQRAAAMRRQLQALADAPLFDEEFLAHLLMIVDATDVRRYLAGEVVVAKDELNETLFLPLEGALRVRSESGQTRDVLRGGVVGATTLLRPRAARATVEARQDSRVLLVDAASLRDVMQRQPRFGLDVLERLGRYLSQELDACRRASDGQVEL